LPLKIQKPDWKPESRNQSQFPETVRQLVGNKYGMPEYAGSIRSIFESMKSQVDGNAELRFVINPEESAGVKALYNGRDLEKNTEGFFRTCMVQDVDYDGRVKYTLGHDQNSAGNFFFSQNVLVEEGNLNDFILTFDKGNF
jgi:hypothetical protein